MTWTVVFYQDERGDSSVQEFLDALPEKAQAKCIDYMLLLEECGNRLPGNYASKVEDNLWELRPEFGGIEYRYFYFSYIDNQIVIVHAISKKSQRLKPGDVRLALSRMEEVRRRESERRAAIEKAKKKMLTQDQYKPLQQYVAEKIAASPTFAGELAHAREGTRLGLALTELREERGLTQRDIAARTGIKQPMLARIERGQMPTLPTLRRIAHALNARVIIAPDTAIVVEAMPLEPAEAAEPKPPRQQKSRKALTTA